MKMLQLVWVVALAVGLLSGSLAFAKGQQLHPPTQQTLADCAPVCGKCANG